jgi:hypothetical protein
MVRSVETQLGCRESYAANNCEFWVDGVARTKVSYQGWVEVGLHAEIVTRTSDAPAELVVGQVVRAQSLNTTSADGDNNSTTRELFTRGKFDRTAGRWLMDTVCQRGRPAENIMSPDLEPETLAYVMKRVKGSVCLWLTDAGGVPFGVETTFVPPVFPEWVGRKEYVWANQRVAVFNQKQACVTSS